MFTLYCFVEPSVGITFSVECIRDNIPPKSSKISKWILYSDGTKGRPNVIRNGVAVDFITRDDFGLNQTTTESGQFPGLVFEQSL
jgi:hypothetical protein